MPRIERKYFVVKHDLDSLRKLPHMIWRTNKGPKDVPHRYRQVNGFLMDILSAPRELQEVAFQKGLIPYIPADRAESS